MSQETIDRILTALRRREPIDIPVSVVVAHPDDETIGAGASLCLFRRLTLIHVTDGAPTNLWDARAAGFATSADYAAARGRELLAALTTGQCLTWGAAASDAAAGKDVGDRVRPGHGCPGPAPLSSPGLARGRPPPALGHKRPAPLSSPGLTRGRPPPALGHKRPAPLSSPGLTRGPTACDAATGKDAGDRVKPSPEAEERPVHAPAGTRRRTGLPIPDQTAALHLPWLVATLRDGLQDTQAVLTHAYEGGHPDHDAVAFAVHATGVPTIEMAGYHAAPNGSIATGRFLPNGEPTVVPLTPEERARRDAMLACFATQRATLEPFFGQTEERFRPAPRYDFTRPAAPRTYFDCFGWGMTSERWCALATEATRC